MRLLFIFCIVLMMSCGGKPREIRYHEDSCAYCKMIVSDPKFGAELVTKKGRVTTYDSAECLFQTVNENGRDQYSDILVTDFLTQTLIDGTSAYYIISEVRPSPMGASLSAYRGKHIAEEENLALDGLVYDFGQILSHFQKE